DDRQPETVRRGRVRRPAGQAPGWNSASHSIRGGEGLAEQAPTWPDAYCSRCRVRRYPGNRETRLRLTCEEEGLMGPASDFSPIPIIDVSELIAGLPSPRAGARRRGEACRASGFFYVVGHGV